MQIGPTGARRPLIAHDLPHRPPVETRPPRREKERARIPFRAHFGRGLLEPARPFGQPSPHRVDAWAPERDDPLFASFADDTRTRRRQIDRVDVERTQLAHAEARSIEKLEHSTIAEPGRGVGRRVFHHFFGRIDRQERGEPTPDFRRRELVGRARRMKAAPAEPAHPRSNGRDFSRERARRVLWRNASKPRAEELDIDRADVQEGHVLALAQERGEPGDVASILGHGPRRRVALGLQVAQERGA